jgi:hypothetical protein
MPAYSRLPIPALLTAATRLYTGLRDHTEIAADLAPFGHDEATATAGLALIADIREASKTQSAEDIEKVEASHASATATAAARAAFSVHRQRARRAHPRGSAGYAALHLAGPIADGEVPMLDEARRFYEALESAPGLASAIRNLPERTVTESLALVTAAERAEDTQIEETGEAQRASALVVPLVARPRAQATLLAADATDALADKPQLREVLGLLER